MKAQTHRRITWVMQIILLLGLLGAIWEQQWLNVLAISGIIGVTFLPLLVAHRFQVRIPAEFQMLAIAFVFASLFLGEVHDYYTRFWWWDVALHTTSGFLLGIIGFLLVYVLNESESVHVEMRPGFVAFFAFMFAVGVGALWEIFEFSMDTLFGMNMQKPMLSDPSGLTDTMLDLIVDAIGALIIAIMGYGYLKTTDDQSFLERWIRQFIQSNPRFFKGKWRDRQ